MNVVEKLSELGYEDIELLTYPNYDDALIGVTTEGRAVYDYDMMVECLIRHDGFTHEDAVEWIEYNTLRALPYYGNTAPIVIHRFSE